MTESERNWFEEPDTKPTGQPESTPIYDDVVSDDTTGDTK